MISKDRWEQVNTIYHAALEYGPDARDAFLAEACGGDEELLNEVESLLKFDGHAENFIATPALELEARAIAAAADSSTNGLPFNDIGPYRLISIISHGGMGDVFIAVDTRLDRKVAIKLLSTEFTADIERVVRFKQEARTTSTLNHPNIVTLFEIGEVDGHHYIVTEYVEGETLRQRIAASPAKQVKLDEALSITIQVVEALNVAHRAGVIHRDIKPENIVLRTDGLIKVLDFGIAKLTAADSESSAEHLTTKTGMIMGTASYMSPEQARGQKVDHRTDIFSVGAMLYEMISGERPFEGETMADVMAAVLVKNPKPLDSLVSNVSPTLQRIVERCLEKDPALRFQTASDLAFSLKEFNSSISRATVTEQSPVESTKAPERSDALFNRKHLVLLGAMIIAAIVIAVLIFQPGASRNQTGKVPVITKPGTGAESATRLVWFDRSGNQLGTVGAPGQYSGPALSPTEDRIAVALIDPNTKSRDLWIFPVGSDSGFRLTNDRWDDLNPVWTPDGRWIIYTSERNGVRNIYRKLSDGTGDIEPVLESNQTSNVEDISRDGQLLMFNTGSGQNREPNLATLSLTDRKAKAFRVASNREDAGRISPDGRWVAYRSQETNDSEIFVRGVTETGSASNQKWMISNGRGGNTQPMWRGDGKALFYLDHKVLTSVEVSSDGRSFISGPPTPLFKVNIEDNERRNRFLVTKDGERFLVIVREELVN